jgi:cytoskeletal protein RodZ
MITSHDRPRLREDLVAEAIEDRGVRFIDVIDPDNGNAYRFYDVEYSLACAMDGERDIPGLVRWAQEELGIAPSPKELQTVIATLGGLGYLDSAAARSDARAAGADPGLAPGVRVAAPAPASGIEVELGRFQATEPVAAKAEPAAELELGVAGGTARVLEIEDDSPDVLLGPSGATAAPSLPVPSAAASSKPVLPTPTPASTVAAALPRPRTNTPHGEGPPSARPPQASRASEPSLRAPVASRPSEPKLRPSEPRVRADGPAASDPSLNLSLPIRPDDVKEAVRASREMRSVDVPAELMQALEAAEQAPVAPPAATAPPKSVPLPAASPPPASVPLTLAARPEGGRIVPSSPASSAPVPSSVLDPIAPLSGAPLSVSEPISPSSVPPLVPAPRPATPAAEARTEVRTKSEPRLEYPRTAEARPALAPAPREPAPVAAAPIPEAPRRSGGMWIVAVLVIAILGVVGFGVWKFVLQKKPVGETPPQTPVTTAPTQPTPPPEAPAEAPAPTVKLSLVKAAPVSVKMPVAGAIQSIIADGTVVKENDEIARLAGGKAIEQNINAAKGDLEKRYPADIARLKAKVAAAPNDRGAQRELANREARVVQRTKDLEGYQAELAKYVLTAKAAGKVTVVAKANARLGLDAEVATIEAESYLSGAVDLGKPVTAQAGDAIEVKQKGDGATASAQCTLETVQDTKVSFRCPLSDGFADGTEVTVEAK